MGVLDEVLNLKNQGFPEEEIIKNLREKGISPKEIKDSLSQLKIKNAISEYESGGGGDLPNSQTEGEYAPKTQEFSGEALPQPGQNYEYAQQNYPQQGYSPQDYASQEGYAGYSAGFDANTIIEISEQVFSEKVKEIQNELNSFNEFKNLNQVRMENLNDRLKKMELVFDRLQMNILEKIGSYGQNLETIKKEMGMMQDSFSKIAEPIIEKAEEKAHFSISKKKNTSKKRRKK
jgi:DNA-binding transcriptional MerR regulator